MNASSARNILLLILGLFGAQLLAQTYTVGSVPNPKENLSAFHVSNPSGILSVGAVMHIDSILSRLEDSTNAQVAVVALQSIGDALPKDYANALFKKWGIGYAGKDNGLLILFVFDQRRVEFETGYGLEGLLPDATCGIIQREKMLPAFRESNYDKGMNAGVEAIVDILSHPDAKKEMSAVQPAAYHASSDLEELDLAELLIFSFFFCFFLVCLRVLRALVRSFNSTKSQVDSVIRKKNGHVWYAFLIYLIIPFSAAALLGITDFLQLLTIGMGGFMLLWYAYIGFTIWDSRRRRMLVFEDLFAQVPEPKKYMLLRSVTRFYWVDALFFPLPFLWFWHKKNKQLSALRDHPRVSADGHLLFKVADDQKAAFLTPHQQVEESLKTVGYDIWRSDIFDVTEAVGYESLSKSRYTPCQKCNSKAAFVVKEEILKAASSIEKGLGKHQFHCKACGETSSEEFTIPVVQVFNSVRANVSSWSSSGSSSWSGSSSSSGSSWGGGRSGGGGAGSSW